MESGFQRENVWGFKSPKRDFRGVKEPWAILRDGKIGISGDKPPHPELSKGRGNATEIPKKGEIPKEGGNPSVPPHPGLFKGRGNFTAIPKKERKSQKKVEIHQWGSWGVQKFHRGQFPLLRFPRGRTQAVKNLGKFCIFPSMHSTALTTPSQDGAPKTLLAPQKKNPWHPKNHRDGHTWPCPAAPGTFLSYPNF